MLLFTGLRLMQEYLAMKQLIKQQKKSHRSQKKRSRNYMESFINQEQKAERKNKWQMKWETHDTGRCAYMQQSALNNCGAIAYKYILLLTRDIFQFILRDSPSKINQERAHCTIMMGKPIVYITCHAKEMKLHQKRCPRLSNVDGIRRYINSKEKAGAIISLGVELNEVFSFILQHTVYIANSFIIFNFIMKIKN